MSPTIYAPKVAFSVYGRDGGAQKDLTGHLTRLMCSRRIDRDNPAAKWGTTLTSAPGRMHGSFAYRVQPMDYVELDIGHGGDDVRVMRGFVDNAGEGIGSDEAGNPQWQVTLNGRDYAALLLNHQIYALPEFDNTAAAYYANIGLEQNFHIMSGQDYSAADFAALVLENVVGPSLASMRGKNPAIPTLALSCTVPEKFTINTQSIQSFTGPIYNLLAFYADSPWIEIFVEDDGGQPTLYYRWAPLKNAGGAIASPYAADPGDVPFSLSDVITHSLTRSGNEAIAYYFTWGKYFAGLEKIPKTEAVNFPGNPYLDEDVVKMFGFRPLELSTYLIPTMQSELYDYQLQNRLWIVEMARELNQWLIDVYSFNEQLFSGTITLAGKPSVRLGKYLYCTDTGWEYYIEGYTHNVNIGGAVTTQIEVTRGRRRVTPAAPEPPPEEVLEPETAPGLPPPSPLPPVGAGGGGTGPYEVM